MADMASKNRGNKAHATITQEIANEIRRLRRSGMRGCDLSRQFGVSESMVCDISKDRTWVIH